MKIIGLLTAWACEDWIEYSIEHALDIVDELIINIGPYNKYFKKIGDKTLKIAEKYNQVDKVKFVPTIFVTNDLVLSYSLNRCATLNKMLQVSENIEKGNVLWLLDADEFYPKEAINEIYNFINQNEDFDVIDLRSLYFCINFEHYFESDVRRLFNIKSKKIHFTPTQYINPKPVISFNLLKNNPMFHYSLLTGEQLRGIFWLGEDHYDLLLWYYRIYYKYNVNDEEYWMRKNEELTGNYGFWFSKEPHFTEKNGHGLFKFEGKHPEIIENSFLRKISDFRIYMREKPNYETYLKVMKEIIAEYKKFSFTKFRREKIFKIMTLLRKRPYFEKILERVNNYLIKIGLTSPKP
jgi:hypothetical protein